MVLPTKTIAVDGLSIDMPTWADTEKAFQDALASGNLVTFVYLNIHVLHMARKHDELRQALQSATHRYCDSDGIRLWLKWRHAQHVAKQTGAGFQLSLLEKLAQHDVRLYLFGSRPAVLEETMSQIRHQFPDMTVAGHHGYLGSDAAYEGVVNDIREFQPQVLLVGLGTPLQETWIAKYRHQLQVPVVWAVGSMFHYISDVDKRAPMWMLRFNLEWLYRFFRQPFRLWPRIVWEIPCFFWRQLWR